MVERVQNCRGRCQILGSTVRYPARLGTSWLGARCVFCRSSASQPSRCAHAGDSVPPKLSCAGSVLPRQPQPLCPFETARILGSSRTAPAAKGKAFRSDIVVAVRECLTLPRRQPVTPALWLPPWLRLFLRCGPQIQRRRVAANRRDSSQCILSLYLLAINRRGARVSGNPCRHYRRRRR